MICRIAGRVPVFHNRVVDKLRDDGEDRRLAAATRRRRRLAAGTRGGRPAANVFSRRADWSPGTTSGSSSTSSCRKSSARRWSTTSSRVADDSIGRGLAIRAFRWSSRRPPIASATAWCGRRIARISPATAVSRSSASSSIRPEEGQIDPVDLRGGARAPRRFIGWQTFFNFGGDQSANVRPPEIIDTKISTPLFNLPLGAIASGDRPTALPQRNLLRHVTWSLPSGQAIARVMRVRALGPRGLSELAGFNVGFESDTPLWYYVLKEAELNGGAQSAGVGARIVGEVFLGLLRLDRESYLWRHPRWTPTLPSRVPGTFGMVDLLTFAGVDPASRHQ